MPSNELIHICVMMMMIVLSRDRYMAMWLFERGAHRGGEKNECLQNRFHENWVTAQQSSCWPMTFRMLEFGELCLYGIPAWFTCVSFWFPEELRGPGSVWAFGDLVFFFRPGIRGYVFFFFVRAFAENAANNNKSSSPRGTEPTPLAANWRGAVGKVRSA